MSLSADSNLQKTEQKLSEKEVFDLLNTPTLMMYSENVNGVTDDRMKTVETSIELGDHKMFQMDVPKRTKYKHRKQCRSLLIIMSVSYYLFFPIIFISFTLYGEVASVVTK